MIFVFFTHMHISEKPKMYEFLLKKFKVKR